MSTTKQKSEKAIIAGATCSAREREAGFSIFFFFILLAKETLRRSGNLEKNVKSGNRLFPSVCFVIQVNAHFRKLSNAF